MGGVIERKIPWTIQPQYPVRRDKSSFGGSNTDFISPFIGGWSIDPDAKISVPSLVTRQITQFGTAILVPRNPSDPTVVATTKTQVWAPGSTVSVALICHPGNFATASPGILTSDSYYFGLTFNSSSSRTVYLRQWNGSIVSTGYTLPSDSSLVVLTLLIVGGASKLYANGVLVYTSAESNTWGSANLYIGHKQGTFNDCNPISILWAGAWNELLSLDKINLLHTPNVWQIFQPIQRRIYVSSAGASVAVTGSGGIAFGSAADITRKCGTVAAGGTVFAGAADIARKTATVGSGGMTFAGAALPARVSSPPAAGGVTFGGSATVSVVGTQSVSVTGSGGIVFGSSAAVAQKQVVTPAGGVIFGGSAVVSSHSSTASAVGSGGIVFAGAAPVSTFVFGSAALRFGRGRGRGVDRGRARYL